MTEPTPEEAAAALRTVHEGKERVIASAMGPRGLSIASGLLVFVYCVIIDLFPATSRWLTWVVVGCALVAVAGLRTRAGSTLLGRPVIVSSRSLPLTVTSRLLRITPIVALGVIAALLVALLHLPHAAIYYGAVAGLYIIFLGPRFQVWLLHRQDKD